MIPGVAIPDPVPLPAPAWLLWALLMLTFVLHVIPMNFVLGGSIIGLVARVQSRGGTRSYPAMLARWIARSMPVAISATVTLGVAALLFLQVLYGRVFFSSSVVMAWGWFAVIPLLIAGYYAAYANALRDGRQGLLLWPVVTTVAVVTIALLFSTNMSLMLRPWAIAEAYAVDGRGLHFDFGDASLLPRFLHIVTGAIATAAMIVCGLGFRRRREQGGFGRWAMRYGALWFTIASILNVSFGLWWMGTLHDETLLALLGQNAIATSVFAGGVTAGLCAMGLIVIAAQVRRPAGFFTAAASCLTIAVVLMLFTRNYVRQHTLDAAGFTQADWTVAQWGPIAIFAILLVVAIGLVAWMTTVLVRSPSRG